MKSWLVSVLFLAIGPMSSFASSFLVENGTPRAEIIIAENPPRTVHLAARDLQIYIRKITGADVPILHEPSGQAVKIYVGESRYTRDLGIETGQLDYGAYRMVSGEDWLVLIGQDTDFTPIEPWPRSNADISSGKMQREWDKITGARWGYTHKQLHKHYSGPNALFGTPGERKTDEAGNVHVWTYDERGSFNAVCGFLRDLGVRWYLPGEIGEVVPELDSIPLVKMDETVLPDFPMRILNFRTSVYGRDAMMWGFRLGVRQPYGRQAAHGLHHMTDNERTLKNHPDWFALYGGKRHNQLNTKNNQLCYSNRELFEETVRFARTQLDHFDMDAVSIMPPDGYTAMCQCHLCEGKDSPELGERGRLSNYVWDFVNRVAREVGKTHPGKRISNCAYGIYTEPPSNIDKLEPNVQVIIVGGRRPTSEDREDLRRLRNAWQKKTTHPIEIFENYPFTGRGFYLPAYIPRVMGESINEIKGQSRGEDIWLTMDFGDDAIGYNHFLIYFTARMYWGGGQKDPGALFDEYVQKFYGPVASQMQQFFDYSEQNWRQMETDGDKAGRALALFQEAKDAVPAESVYADRIALIDNYLNGLRNKATMLSQKRGPVPTLRLVSGVEQRGEIIIDGKLDDGPWQQIPVASTGHMSELQTGRMPTYGTRVKAEWIGSNLYLAIRCEEKPGEALNIGTKTSGDQAIWYGDAVEILLATERHSYYQIVVNPAGAMIDLDRGAPKNSWFGWSSKAEVATRVEDDYWTVEIRIPVTQDENDPLHQVIGSRPTKSLPWHINLCRQRVRTNGTELSAFSPTGTGGFHEPMKFAHLFRGNSHKFAADDSVTDYILSSRQASDLERTRQWQQARESWLQLAKSDKVTDLQQSEALQHAALCSVNLEQPEQAEKQIAQIPIESVASTAAMQCLAAQRLWQQIADQFAGVDFSEWPFWQIAEGAFVRGKAQFFTGNATQAEQDLKLALQYEPDTRIQTSIRTLMAQNRETRLGDDATALKWYLANLEGKDRIGGADEFRSLERAAAILGKQGQHDRALATFDVVDFSRLNGIWKHVMTLARGDTLFRAGNKTEAEQAWRSVAEDTKASDVFRKRARNALENGPEN